VPDRRVHEAVDKLLFNKKCTTVHKILDLPSKWLGEKHRILLHDPLTAMLIGFLVDRYEGAMSALLHIALDKQLSSYIRRKK